MDRIPNIVHFVVGLRPQLLPFHVLHYIAIESCLRTLRPEKVYLHYRNLPFGAFWDLLRPHLTLVRVDPEKEMLESGRGAGLVSEPSRYARYADFVRLDALIEHGGLCADIDVIFLRPFPGVLYRQPFVIGEEQEVRDETTREIRRSLCKAVLMAPSRSFFAETWRQRMADARDGTWNNDSGMLAYALSEELPEHVHVEPPESFCPIPWSREGLRALFEGPVIETAQSYSVHLWEHAWWDAERTDFSHHHAGELTLSHLRDSDTPLGRMVQPFLPDIDVDDLRT